MSTLFEKFNEAFLIISFVFLHDAALLNYMMYQVDVKICTVQRDLYVSYVRLEENNMLKNRKIYVFL